MGVILGEDGVLVIDTRASHVEARELVADLAHITTLPVRWVVNTHFHWDHTFGNAVFPDAEIWGHTKTREALLEIGTKMKAGVQEWLGEERAAEIEEVEITPPERVFSDRASLLIGREVRLSHHGKAHTDSDVVVRVDDVLFAGDIVEEGAPPGFDDSFPVAWPETLGMVLSEPAGVIVPGHGTVVDAEFADTQREELSRVAELARAVLDDPDSITDRAGEGPYPAEIMEEAFKRALQVAGG